MSRTLKLQTNHQNHSKKYNSPVSESEEESQQYISGKNSSEANSIRNIDVKKRQQQIYELQGRKIKKKENIELINEKTNNQSKAIKTVEVGQSIKPQKTKVDQKIQAVKEDTKNQKIETNFNDKNIPLSKLNVQFTQQQKEKPLKNQTINGNISPQSQNKQIPKEKKKDRQIQVIKNIKNEKENIQKNLKSLLNEHIEIEQDVILFKKRDQSKQKKIKKFLNNLQNEKQLRRQKIEKINQKQSELLAQSLKPVDNEQEIKQRKKKIEQSYSRRVAEIERNRVRREKQQQQFKQFYKNYKNAKPVFKIKQQNQLKRQQEQQLHYKQKLKANSKRFKPLTEEEIEQHIQQYQQSLQQLENAKFYQRQIYLKKIKEQNEKLANIWKGNVHKIVEQQIQNQQRKKEEPKLKRKRIQQYNQKIRQARQRMGSSQTSKPTHKSQDYGEELPKQSNTHRIVRRYRYVKGVAYGQVEENLPKQKSETQKKQMGNMYLEYLKSLPKKQKNKQQFSFQIQEVPIFKPKAQVPKIRKQIDPLYNRRSLDYRLSDNPTREQYKLVLHRFHTVDAKIKQQQQLLKHEINPDLLSYRERQKRINDELVKSIGVKLQLLAQI